MWGSFVVCLWLSWILEMHAHGEKHVWMSLGWNNRWATTSLNPSAPHPPPQTKHIEKDSAPFPLSPHSPLKQNIFLNNTFAQPQHYDHDMEAAKRQGFLWMLVASRVPWFGHICLLQSSLLGDGSSTQQRGLEQTDFEKVGLLWLHDCCNLRPWMYGRRKCLWGFGNFSDLDFEEFLIVALSMDQCGIFRSL